jgi:sugar/nucleoside kinase (ribokinase family)
VTLVVLGDVMVDVVAAASGPLARGSDTPARVRITGGGAGANVAWWAARLGGSVALVARVGDDAAGREAVDGLARTGVDVRAAVDRDRATGTCVVIVEPGGERSMLPDPGANNAPARLPEDLVAAGSHLHVAGYALLRDGSRAAALDAVALAGAGGMTTSLDASSAALLAPGAFGDVRFGLLRCNADELRALTGADDPAALLGLAEEVVVTFGADGALWTAGERSEHVPAVPAPVVDTTGAGDAFTAGLLTARLAGAAPAKALAAGARAAAQAVTHLSAR